jgi:hypothetical protein
MTFVRSSLNPWGDNASADEGHLYLTSLCCLVLNSKYLTTSSQHSLCSSTSTEHQKARMPSAFLGKIWVGDVNPFCRSRPISASNFGAIDLTRRWHDITRFSMILPRHICNFSFGNIFFSQNNNRLGIFFVAPRRYEKGKIKGLTKILVPEF